MGEKDGNGKRDSFGTHYDRWTQRANNTVGLFLGVIAAAGVVAAYSSHLRALWRALSWTPLIGVLAFVAVNWSRRALTSASARQPVEAPVPGQLEPPKRVERILIVITVHRPGLGGFLGQPTFEARAAWEGEMVKDVTLFCPSCLAQLTIERDPHFGLRYSEVALLECRKCEWRGSVGHSPKELMTLLKRKFYEADLQSRGLTEA